MAQKKQPFRPTRRGEGQLPPEEPTPPPSERSVSPVPSPIPPPSPSVTPRSCVYSAEEFMALRGYLHAVRPLVRQWAGALWDNVEETRPDHMFTRDGMFQKDSSALGSRQFIVKDRRLRNEVLGVLTRVTADNYATIEQQLLALPIRQSGEEEINEVIRMIFEKAINPVDGIYVQLYVRLICALVNHIGDHPVGTFIRKAMVTNCQQKFTDNPLLKQELDTTGLEAEEANEKREKTVLTLKSTLSFLGLLFVNGFVSEKVVCFVLYQLIFGNPEGSQATRKKRRCPADYEVDLFAALFMCTAPKLTVLTLKYLPSFRTAMEDVFKTHRSKRIQFKAEDMLHFMNQESFAEVKPKNEVLSVNEFMRETQRNELRRAEEIQRLSEAAASTRRSAPHRIETRPQLTLESVRTHLQRCLGEDGDEGLVAFRQLLERAPPSVTVPLLAEAIERPMTTVKLAAERTALPSLLMKVVDFAAAMGVFTQHVQQWVKNQQYEDHVLYYSTWVAMVYANDGIPGLVPALLAVPFEALLAARPSVPQELAKYLAEVQKAAPMKNPNDRLRVLPALLSFVPLGEEVEEGEAAEDAPLDVDIFEELEAVSDDVRAFQMLSRGEAVGKVKELPALPIVSALFTYYRCALSDMQSPDTLYAAERCCEAIRQCRQRTDDALIVVEAYRTWKALQCLPKVSFEVFCVYLMAPPQRGARSLQCSWDVVRKAVLDAGGSEQDVAFMRTRSR